MTRTQQARKLAERCADAYSADRYRSWSHVAFELLKMGLTEQEAEAVMRSKWTRWAADVSGQAYGRVQARWALAYTKNQPYKDIVELTQTS